MRFITLLFAALLLAASAFAENGKIAGKISDKTYGEAVIGAAVSVQGMSIGTVTDVDGNFTISVPTGEYVIEVKYLGYQPKNIEGVAVKANQTTTVSVVMEESKSTEMEEVVVTARLERETVNALYIQQRNNVSLSSGISADIIQRSPDKNTGEVLKRVSGASIQNGKYVIIRGLNDRYNMAMLNNALMPSTEADRKAFSFDVIPSNLIDNIIINKTATPEMPGDFAGGVVKVLTKDVPERNFINVGVSAGYNTQSTFKDFVANERTGATYFGYPEKETVAPGFGKSYEDYNKLSRNDQYAIAKEMPNKNKEVTTSAMPNTSLNVSAGSRKEFKNGGKLGIIAGVSTRNSQIVSPEFIRAKYEQTPRISSYSTETQYRYAASTAAIANLSYVKGKSKISFKNLYNNLYDNTYFQREGISTSGNQQTQVFSSIPSERRIMNNQLEGSHAFGARNIKLDWNLNYSGMNSGQRDLRTTTYGRSVTFDRDDNPLSDVDPYLLIPRDTRRFFSEQTDNNYGGSFDVTVPFELAGAKQSVKAGYLTQMKDRVFSARVFQYASGGLTPDEMLALPVDQVLNPENIGAAGLEIQELQDPTNRYDASASLHAAYLMLDNTIGSKLRVIWGARYESYTQNLYSLTRGGTLIDQTTPFNDILPSLNLTYDINEKQKARFAVSRTVNRPEFREIAPFSFIDYENIWSVVGNPALVRSNITNFDLRYEIYPNAGETITFGVFYKNFKNPIEAVMDPQTNLDFFIFGYQNALSAYTAGIEFEARKKLGFIGNAAWWDNFTAATNLSYIYSRVDASNIIGFSPIIGTKTIRPLQGQSPYIINFSLMYNAPKSGWSASALYNRIGERIAVVGSATIPTTWENSRNVIDLQVSKRVLKNKGELKLTVSDLLNQATVLYWNTNESNGYQGGDNKLGFENGQAVNDQVFQKYKLGTGISLGFNYRIGE